MPETETLADQQGEVAAQQGEVVADGPPPDVPYEEPRDEQPVEPEDLEPGDEERELAPDVEVDDEEILEPKVLPVVRQLTDAKGVTREYVQAPMLYFQKFELYGLLGRAVQIVMDGERGLGLGDLGEIMNPRNLIDEIQSRMPGYDDAPDRAEDTMNIEDASKMIAAFARVISASPDMLKEAYCIVLDVPKAHRIWAMEWSLPKIDDELGTDVMHTFIDQNWALIEGFFFEELPRIFKRAAQARARSATARSKR